MSGVISLTINFAETKIVHFGSKAKKSIRDCIVDECRIESVHSYTYLGYLLDQELNFKSDMKQTIRTISQNVFMFKKIKPFLTNKSRLDVAKSMILSYFDYSNIFYGICTEDEKDDLQKLQNNFLRSALGINNPRDISNDDLHTDTCTLFLDKRRIMQLLVLFTKVYIMEL